MKSIAICLFVLLPLTIFNVLGQGIIQEGAYRIQNGPEEAVLVFVDGYLSHSSFNQQSKAFVNTWGGPYQIKDKQVVVQVQYNTQHQEEVGKEKAFSFSLNKGTLVTQLNNEKALWTSIDHNDSPLSGVWRIIGRQADGKINEMPLRDRRTLKILSGTRFQWVAINIKTGEFSGTGGGTYSFKDGTYTENIEFFSRDGSRVGSSLSFTGKIEQGKWHHSGLSSKGSPIYEIWGKMEGYY